MIGVDAILGDTKRLEDLMLAVRSCWSVEQRAYPLSLASWVEVYGKGSALAIVTVPFI